MYTVRTAIGAIGAYVLGERITQEEVNIEKISFQEQTNKLSEVTKPNSCQTQNSSNSFFIIFP